jgi:DNA-binding response OmpR family regulator
MNERIMIISDDEPNGSLQRALDGHGFTVTVAEDANDGYERLSQSQFDLVIVDLNRPITGVSLIKRIRSNPALRRLMVLTIAEWGTGQPTMALAQGADGFEPAPIDAGRLVAAVTKLLRPNMVMTATASATNAELDE